MKKLKINPIPTRKKILPLIMTLGNRLIESLGFVELINKHVQWDKARWNISPGSLAKILVLSTFTDIRIPLSHLDERLDGIDIDFFLHSGETGNVNTSNVGEALERIGQIDYNSLYETLALTMVHTHDVPVNRYHADTTTVSFYGEYDVYDGDLTEEEVEQLLHIERGYNKDGRPESK